MTDLTRLEGRVALVTGAGSGIGQAIARRFAAEGAAVVANDLRGPTAQATVDGLPGSPSAGAHLAVEADVSDRAQVDAMYADVDERFDRLDVVVNCAGVAEAVPGELQRANENAERVMADVMSAAMSGSARTEHWEIFREVTDEAWDRMLAIHLSGTFYNMQAAVPLMVECGGGSIVNISSAAGVAGTPGAPHYSAAKAGILGLTRATAVELASRGIRVNAILPGLIDTPASMTESPSALRDLLAGAAPLRRSGRPEEIASVAAFLASDDASFMTGQSVEVNGGVHM
jgi:3-oxoacyl-[acyl-carrier protein] reductase